ncbi:MAG: hypothetical protein E6I76_17685 [Chloroflexi bacterium]|nr:MAG: hypothetical protein E6J03_12690 [Chloroflexota bacterium]TMD92203.1 MAG: hypothetical protein E6I76_17685 [Chloroflexota bacterium]
MDPATSRPGRSGRNRTDRHRPRYLPIGEHGLIGDLRTVALVGTTGTSRATSPRRSPTCR